MDPFTRTVQPLKWRRKRSPLSEEVRKTYLALAITLSFLGILSTAAYLTTNSFKPAKGYQLKQLQVDQETLERENRKLERQVIDAGSFIQIENSDALKEMQELSTNDVSYAEEQTFARDIE